MYIQITTKCNMTCEHCGFACTQNGKDMPEEVFKAALELAFGEYVSIGGGEPTIHPEFWAFIGQALGSDIEGLWMATNGKERETALKLARLAAKEIMSVELSQDAYHDEISDDVVEAFHSLGALRSVSEIVPAGRARNWGWYDECLCEGLLVDPDGKIWACGCKKEQFGTVFHPEVPDDYYERDRGCSERHNREEMVEYA